MRPVLESDGDVISGVEGSEFSHGAGVARSGHDLDGAVCNQPQRGCFDVSTMLAIRVSEKYVGRSS